MTLHRLLAERRLDIDLSRGALDRKRFVVTAFGRHAILDDAQSFQTKNKHPRFAAGGAVFTYRSGITVSPALG
jgi:hypothetical protein